MEKFFKLQCSTMERFFITNPKKLVMKSDSSSATTSSASDVEISNTAANLPRIIKKTLKTSKSSR